MIDYRNILRLHSEGHSQRAMERELYCSRHTIADVLDKAKKAGISWPLGEDCVSRSENRSCTGFEPHSRRSWNRTCAAHLTAHVPVKKPQRNY